LERLPRAARRTRRPRRLADPFARTKEECQAAGDPRPSLEERYGGRETYIAKVKAPWQGHWSPSAGYCRPTPPPYVETAKACDRL